MKRLGKLLSYLILGLAIVFFSLVLLMPRAFSGTLAIVRSSSMEPAMPAGAIALMLPVDPEKIEVGDIIAFEPPWDPDVTVSHRVIDIRRDGQLLFDTKGDATEDSDPYYVPAESVHGRVIFSIPYLGFAANNALDYVRTWWGLAVFVAMPAALLVGFTFQDIRHYGNLRERRLKSRQKRRRRR